MLDCIKFSESKVLLLPLRSVPVWMMREFNEQRPYDLIILQYGLNVATERHLLHAAL